MANYYYLASLLFSLGVYGVLTKRDLVSILICSELMIVSVNLLLILFSKNSQSLDPQVFVFFVITIAALEAAIGLAIIISLFNKSKTTELENINIFSEDQPQE